MSMLPFDVMSGPPESYSGCIRNLHLNNILLALEQQNIQGKYSLSVHTFDKYTRVASD